MQFRLIRDIGWPTRYLTAKYQGGDTTSVTMTITLVAAEAGAQSLP